MVRKTYVHIYKLHVNLFKIKTDMSQKGHRELPKTNRDGSRSSEKYSISHRYYYYVDTNTSRPRLAYKLDL